MYNKEIKAKAIELRKLGFAYAYISKELNLSKSTLSLWLRDTVFLPNEMTKLSISRGQKICGVAKRVDKIRSIVEAGKFAVDKVDKLSNRDVFMLGIGIYIGEGSKTHDNTRIVNADPRIVKFSLVWLNKCFDVPIKSFRVRLHLYPDTNQDEAIRYWMDQLSLPKQSFQSCTVDRRVNKKLNKAGILPYGTAHLSLVSNGNKALGVLLHRKIIATIDRVLEK